MNVTLLKISRESNLCLNHKILKLGLRSRQFIFIGVKHYFRLSLNNRTVESKKTCQCPNDLVNVYKRKCSDLDMDQFLSFHEFRGWKGCDLNVVIFH